MSSSSTPALSSRGSTPALHSVSPSLGVVSNGHSWAVPPQISSKPSSAKAKASNVFSNDGSFLERFQRTKKDEDEKKKQQDELLKKRTFEDRFKNRSKRRAPDSDNPSVTAEDPPAKKAKPEKLLTEYEREVKSYAGSLKDNGMGVRPLVK